jgi:hypothetical protein
MKDTMAKEVKAILNKPAKSKKPDGTPRKYGYLLDGRFAIERAAYVEKKMIARTSSLENPLTFPALH